MKVGDLVRVYNFTHRARTSGCFPTTEASRLNAHFVGLIVAGNGGDTSGNYRKVLRCDSSDAVTDLYNVARLEVISESR